MNESPKIYYHVTVLSNFLLGFDKYSKTYSKKNIPKSTFSNEFYLLGLEDLNIGINKAKKLLQKLNIKGDKLLLINVLEKEDELYPNTRNGLGLFVKKNWVNVDSVAIFNGVDFEDVVIEDVIAKSYQLRLNEGSNYNNLTPRSISILPIAIGCQAKCHFCFSKSSISVDQKSVPLDYNYIEKVLQKAKKEGAIRAVITGGGEPTMLKNKDLINLINLCSKYYSKTVLITNGYTISNSEQPDLMINSLVLAGLTTLAISRHHYDSIVNAKLMGINISFEKIAVSNSNLKLRLICVLQKNGIETVSDVIKYIEWAANLQVEEVCFKELYISSSTESMYYDRDANNYSRLNQISLSIITKTAKIYNWKIKGRLPWGAPIYELDINNRKLTVAAYTEPSVSWELENKLCRSWNLMSDMKCFASLETKNSEILVE